MENDQNQLETTPLAPPSQPMPGPEWRPPRSHNVRTALIISAVFVGIALLGLFGLLGRLTTATNLAKKAVPSPFPTPTPIRQSSPLASQAAFLTFVAHTASLSGSIQNFTVGDPTLTPPVLDLPLGFTN